MASSEEKTNGSKLSRLLIDGGTTVLRNVFNYHHPPANLAAKLNANYSALNNLLRRRVLNGHQWDKLFPPGGAMPDSNTFDITLLFLLLINICGLSPPPTGWHAKPPRSDNSYEANLARVKYFRNVLYGHVTSTSVDTHSFSVLWLEISAVLVALGLHQSEIDRLKAERGGEEDYLDALRDWTDCEIEIKTQLKGVYQAQKEMKQTLLETHETFQESKAKLEDIHEVVTEIRQAQLNTDQEEDILKQLAKVDTENIIKYHSERYLEGTRVSIFVKVTNWLNDNNSFHRVMVIVGNAGMGKSVITAEVSKRMQQDRRLLGSHFRQHNKMRHRNPKVMLQSLACHLSYSLPEYKEALVEQLSRNLGLDINDMETEDLFELLFEEPLNRLSDPGFTSLVVIDALDESEYQGRNELLEVIAKYFNKLPIWIRFLVTTRPEINIWDSLKGLRPLLLEPNDEEKIKDIRHLFERNLRPMFQVNNHESILTELVQKSEGIISWAQLLVDFIKEKFSVLKREHLDGTIPLGISSVYQSYFKRLETELCKQLNMSEDMFLSLLSVIVASREPLPLGFVSNFLFPGKVSSAVQRKVSKVIACISSLLPVQEGCIHFFHKSVKGWLVDQSYYGKHSFSLSENEGHLILARLCGNKFDEVKRKGVDRSQHFDEVTKYALRHGVQHMLQLDEDIRPSGLEEIVNKYILDVELVYAKLRVDSAIPAEDIACITKFSVQRQAASKTLLFLLRKHIGTLKQLPHVIFQTLLNEGGPELCYEASNLLKSKYSYISHMEYLDKNNLEGTVQTKFHYSSEVACFDVSPSSDYMVCECRDGTIQLWSLQTGKLVWKRPVIKMKLYSRFFQAFRTAAPASFSPHFLSLPLSEVSTFALSCFRSVVFHPTRRLVLPGVLSETYSFDGDLNRLFPESNCIFSVCSVSGDTILTDCPDNAKCLILWSLSNGAELTRTTRDHNVLTFARSQDGRIAAISHSDGSVCLVDLMSNFRLVAETVLQSICGMIKFSPDHRFLYCWHCPLRYSYQHPDFFKLTVSTSNVGNVFLDVASENASYVPWEWESPSRSGFMLGDPLCCRSQTSPPSLGTFVFVLNKQSILRSNPRSGFIEMLFPYEQTKCSYGDKVNNSLKLSLTGDTVYSKDDWGGSVLFTAWDVSSGARKAALLIKPDKEGIAKPMRQFTDTSLAAVQTMTGTRVGRSKLYEQDESGETRAAKVIEQDNDCSGSDYDWHKSRSPKLRKSFGKTMLAATQTIFRTRMGRKKHYEHYQKEELRANKVSEQDNDITSSDGQQHKKRGLRPRKPLIPPQTEVEQDKSGEPRAAKVIEQDNDYSGSDYDWHKSRSPKLTQTIFRTGMERKKHRKHYQRKELRADKVSEQDNGVSTSDDQQHKKGGLRPRKPLIPPQTEVEQDESGEPKAAKVTEQDNDCSGSDYDWHKSKSPKLRKSFGKTMLAATQTIFRTRMGRKKHYEHYKREELRADKVSEQDNDITSSDGQQHKKGGLRPRKPLIPPQTEVEQDKSGEPRAAKVIEQDNDCSGSEHDWHKSRSPKLTQTIFRTGMERKKHRKHYQREELRAYKVNEQGNGVSTSDDQQHKKGGLRPRKPLIPPQTEVEQGESGEPRAAKVTEQDNDCCGLDYDWHKSRRPKLTRTILRTRMGRKTHYEHYQREELRADKVSEQDNGVSISDDQQHKKGGLRPRKPLKPPQTEVELDESGEPRTAKVTEQDNDCSGLDYDWHKSRSPKLRKSFGKTMLAATQTIFRTRMGRKTQYEYDQSEEHRAEKVNEQDNDISSSDGDQHKRGGLRLINELARVWIFRYLPVKKGVLLVLCLEERCTLELWNFQLSKCIESWSCLGQFKRVIPVSEEVVCLISPSSREVKIFDTSSGYEQFAMCFLGKFIACNSKCQVLATLGSQTIVLLQGKTVIWKKYWPRSGYRNFICERFSFSPDDQFFVISGVEQGHGVYLLDAYSGSTLQMLWKGEADRSVFVSNDECVVQTSEPPSVTCLRLFNVRSGQQLSVLNIESQLTALTISPWNGLIAICEKNTNHNFRVILLRLSGDNEEKRTIKGQLSI